jgi:hypothetical protein
MQELFIVSCNKALRVNIPKQNTRRDITLRNFQLYLKFRSARVECDLALLDLGRALAQVKCRALARQEPRLVAQAGLVLRFSEPYSLSPRSAVSSSTLRMTICTSLFSGR